jgi:Domain of unknown function (DUF4037)
MPAFVRGLQLAEAFYRDIVGPLLGSTAHSAALIGEGSEVLGFDTERSTDHGWGPRLQVFVEPSAVEGVSRTIDAGLPDRFMGWPVRFGWDEVPVTHHVEVASLDEWLRAHLGFDPREGVALFDWLSTPQQLLLELVAGRVFHDGLGELEPVRSSLTWYPDDLWLWLLACQWRRLEQEEPFVGRTAQVGDELGSRLLAARLCRDLVRLCFLMERRYPPYAKWLGSAFSRLDAFAEVGPALSRTLRAEDQPARERALVDGFEAVARRHNALGITEPQDPTVRLFYDRPFLVLGSGRFVEACLGRVGDARLRALPLIGAVDQFADSTDVLSSGDVARRVSGGIATPP